MLRSFSCNDPEGAGWEGDLAVRHRQLAHLGSHSGEQSKRVTERNRRSKRVMISVDEDRRIERGSRSELCFAITGGSGATENCAGDQRREGGEENAVGKGEGERLRPGNRQV